MQSEGSVLIDRPIDEVFRITRECIAQWSHVVVHDHVTEDVNNGDVGTRFQTITDSNGQELAFEGVVTHCDPPYAFASKLTGDQFDIEVAYSFEQVDAHTKVTQWSNVRGKGLFGWILRFAGWAMKKASCEALQRELDSLRHYCEQTEPAETA